MPDVKISQLAATSPATRAAGAALWTHKGHIEGLRLEWLSGTSLRVTSGSAYIESLGFAIDVPAAITKSSLALSADTWYHVYLFDNAGAPDIEIVTAAPAAAYSGTARSKTADTSRRYVGSVRTDGAGALWNFLQSGLRVQWQSNQGAAPFRALAAGLATVETNVSLAAVVPSTARIAQLRLINLSSDAVLNVGNSVDSTTGGIAALTPTPSGGTESQAFMDFPIDTTQQVNYKFQSAPTGTGAFIDVYGYTFER